ncbi:MAG: YbaY family lipoprotein [Pseudomonadota bacterium]|nr:YbaY family lipoprotein [Pseudomonadota bacterium]MDQ2704783.1 YbaY family lipoprotein [Pseudomonadota bacterium]
MLGKLAELFIFGFAPLVIGSLLLPGAVAAEEVAVTGEVTYRERIALPPNAVLTVRLLDVSLADAPETVVGEQKIDPAGQVPIAFEIKFDPAVIQPKVNYALQARITVDDRLMFINDERHPVDPAKPEPVEMVLKMVRQDAGATPATLFDTTWIAEDINGGGVIDNAQSTFSVTADGKVTGSGACNRFFAEAEIKDDRITIGKAGASMMACPEAVMDQEQKFFAALEKAASYRIDGDGKLFLVDANGVDLVRFSAEG